MRLCLDSVFQDSHSLGFMKVRLKSLVYGTKQLYATCLCQVAALARCHMNGSILIERTIEKNNRNNAPNPNQKQLLYFDGK